MRILRLVDRGRPVLRVGEVSRELGLQKSTVSRLLRTMSEHELVERERHGQGYVAGRRGLVLADLYLSAHSLLELVDGAIEALVSEFEFVGYVGVLSGSDIVLLRVRHGHYPLRLVQEVGKRIPAILTSLGFALLARKSDAEVSELLREEAGAKPARIVARLDEIRRNGTAAISSAIIPGIGAIGAAVGEFGRRGARLRPLLPGERRRREAYGAHGRAGARGGDAHRPAAGRPGLGLARSLRKGDRAALLAPAAAPRAAQSQGRRLAMSPRERAARLVLGRQASGRRIT